MASVPAVYWLLLFTCAIVTYATDVVQWDEGEYPEDTRDAKFFSLFNVIRFRNVQCVGTNNFRGTCFARKECAAIGGISSGSCARGWGTCCIIQKTCGESTNLNCTYFSNTNYPGFFSGSGRCSIAVNKCNSNICQLRLDFLDFTLGQPDANGNCNNDNLVVTGGASVVPVICGENSGQHVYVDFQPDNSPIQISVSTNPTVSANRKWNIKITQIECTSAQRAPSGCLMYYTALSGKVMSFNYDSSGRGIDIPWTRELANLNYGVCVEMAPNYCTIEWSQPSSDQYSFTVSGDTEVAPELLGNPLGEVRGENCTTDFVVIPNPYTTAGVPINSDRFCGNGFLTKQTSSKPFVMTVVTNSGEIGNGTLDHANRGFCLNYRQLPCR